MITFTYPDTALQFAFTSVSTKLLPRNTASAVLNRGARRYTPSSRRRLSVFLVLILGLIAAPVHAYTLSLEPSTLTLTEGEAPTTITMVISEDGSEMKGFCRINADIVVRPEGTAHKDSNFSFMPQEIEFPNTRDFPATQAITVTVADDNIAEAKESFTLGISVNAQKSYCFLRHIKSDATVTIKDNDSSSSRRVPRVDEGHSLNVLEISKIAG